jgi:AcrR family transcriptional regulator
MQVSDGRIDIMTPAARHRARRGEGERLRGEILAAAEQLLIETADESAVSIRAIADRVGVTPPSIYRHFPDKETLMLAVCQDVFTRLDDALQKAASDATDPLDELMRKGRAYIEYGLANPESYRLLFMLKRPPRERGEVVSPGDLPGTQAFVHLQETVERILALAEAGTLVPDPYEMTCAVWTAVHGITSLRISLAHFPWPSVEHQLTLVTEPWRQALCPHTAAQRTGGSLASGR